MLGRFTYDRGGSNAGNIDINFTRRWNKFLPIVMQNRIDNVAKSGIREHINFFKQDKISVAQNLQSATDFEQLRDWFDFAEDGSHFTLLRDRNLGAYMGFEGKSLADNDRNAGTFTRALVTDSAHYLDPSTGLVTAVNTVDIPRFPAGQYGRGVLIEGARTNLITRSETFGTTWVPTNITVDNNTTETLDPAGNNTAEKLTASAANGTINFDTATATGSNDACFPVYLKSGQAGNVAAALLIIGDAGGSSTQAITVTPNGSDGNGFTRFEINVANAGFTGDWQARIRIDTNTDVIYAWGAEFNAGADVRFPSSYIKADAGSTVTRAVEALTYSTTNVINELRGTIGFWFNPEWVHNQHPTAQLVFIPHGTGGTSDRYLVIEVTSAGNFSCTVDDGVGTAVISISTSASGMSQNTWHHIVFTYDTTIANGGNLYLDGTLLDTSSNSAFNPNVVGTTYQFSTSSNAAWGTYDDFFIRRDVLDASSINRMFNRGAALAEQRNRWTAELLQTNFPELLQKGANRYNWEAEFLEVLS